MSIAFCSFVKRDDRGNPILDFIFWHGSVKLKIGRKSVKHMNCVEYTEEEFDAIDFESLDSSPCAFWAYKGCTYVEAFELADDEFASMLISRKDVSEYVEHNVSATWVALCKQYETLLLQDGVKLRFTKDALESSVRSIQSIETYMKQAMEYARANGSTDDLSMLIVDMRENK